MHRHLRLFATYLLCCNLSARANTDCPKAFKNGATVAGETVSSWLTSVGNERLPQRARIGDKFVKPAAMTPEQRLETEAKLLIQHFTANPHSIAAQRFLAALTDQQQSVLAGYLKLNNLKIIPRHHGSNGEDAPTKQLAKPLPIRQLPPNPAVVAGEVVDHWMTANNGQIPVKPRDAAGNIKRKNSMTPHEAKEADVKDILAQWAPLPAASHEDPNRALFMEQLSPSNRAAVEVWLDPNALSPQINLGTQLNQAMAENAETIPDSLAPALRTASGERGFDSLMLQLPADRRRIVKDWLAGQESP